MRVAGFGFRSAASVDSLANALAQTGERAMPDVLATLPEKADADAMQSLSKRLGVPVVAASPVGATATQSAASRAAHGTGSVAEATALAAAGDRARLISPRVISDDRMATCAIATSGAQKEQTS